MPQCERCTKNWYCQPMRRTEIEESRKLICYSLLEKDKIRKRRTQQSNGYLNDYCATIAIMHTGVEWAKNWQV